jgi:hypothetical protein
MNPPSIGVPPPDVFPSADAGRKTDTQWNRVFNA